MSFGSPSGRINKMAPKAKQTKAPAMKAIVKPKAPKLSSPPGLIGLARGK